MRRSAATSGRPATASGPARLASLRRRVPRLPALRASPRLTDVTDCCLAATVGLAVLVVWNVHYLLSQPYWLDEAWVADSVRAPLAVIPRLSARTPLGWVLLLPLVPLRGPD